MALSVFIKDKFLSSGAIYICLPFHIHSPSFEYKVIDQLKGKELEKLEDTKDVK